MSEDPRITRAREAVGTATEHEDYCCAKGCAGYGFCAGCDGTEKDCNCMVGAIERPWRVTARDLLAVVDEQATALTEQTERADHEDRCAVQATLAGDRWRAEYDRIVAERDRLQRWKDEAIEVMIGLQDLGKALGVPLGTRITSEVGVAAAKELRDRAETAEAKLADAWDEGYSAGYEDGTDTGMTDAPNPYGGDT